MLLARRKCCCESTRRFSYWSLCDHSYLLAYASHTSSVRSYCAWLFGFSLFRTGFESYSDRFASNPLSSARRTSSPCPVFFWHSMTGLREWEADGEESKRWAKLEGQSREDKAGRAGQTGDDEAGCGHSGTGSHLYARGRGPYFRSEHSVRFSTTYHPLLRRSRCAHDAAQGAAEGVNGVLHRAPRVRVVCVGCLAPVLVTCAGLV